MGDRQRELGLSCLQRNQFRREHYLPRMAKGWPPTSISHLGESLQELRLLLRRCSRGLQRDYLPRDSPLAPGRLQKKGFQAATPTRQMISAGHRPLRVLQKSFGNGLCDPKDTWLRTLDCSTSV